MHFIPPSGKLSILFAFCWERIGNTLRRLTRNPIKNTNIHTPTDSWWSRTLHLLVFRRCRSVQAFTEGALYFRCQAVHGEDRCQSSVALHSTVGETLISQIFYVLSSLVEHVLTLGVLVPQVLHLQTGDAIVKLTSFTIDNTMSHL